MNHVLFEEDGAFKAGTVMSEAPASLQVEHASGKRSKVKAANVVLRFQSPAPGELLPEAQRVAEDLDIDFLWECAPQDEFAFTDLAGEYFGGEPTAPQATGVLLKLQGAPIYFQRKGRGRYRPAPAETVRLALAAVERRRQQELALEAHALDMVEGRLPEAIAAQAIYLLARPDRQSIEYRALERACEQTRKAPERLLLELGAFASPYDLHYARFTCEQFPRGTGFPPSLEAPQAPTLDAFSPPVDAFSIDDSSTTEIDDALSVQTLPDGRLRIGVHIAAPALSIDRDDALDAVARDRMSTVYMPGGKITMLPEAAIRPFSLDEGTERAAVSLYVDLDSDGSTIVQHHSVVDRIRIVANLRHDLIDGEVTEAAIEDPSAPIPFGDALRALWKLTLALCAERERVRGRPEPRGRADFSFEISDGRVRIVQRRRDAPLDRIVAEMAILANSEWGRLLAEHRVACVYRSQQMGRVKMGTHALPHQGLGVAQYAWTTSPLRRYIDLINQRQLIAVLRGDKPPFAGNDAELFSIVSAFDARHGAYGDFQSAIERYWCLRWIAQEGLRRVDAVVVRDDLVRLADAPLYFRMADVPQLAAGRRIVVDILATDEVDLSVQARFVEVSAGVAEDIGAEEAGADDPGADGSGIDGSGVDGPDGVGLEGAGPDHAREGARPDGAGPGDAPAEAGFAEQG